MNLWIVMEGIGSVVLRADAWALSLRFPRGGLARKLRKKHLRMDHYSIKKVSINVERMGIDGRRRRREGMYRVSVSRNNCIGMYHHA